jgi:hypothetical protein
MWYFAAPRQRSVQRFHSPGWSENTLFNPALPEALLSRDNNGAGAPEKKLRMLLPRESGMLEQE